MDARIQHRLMMVARRWRSLRLGWGLSAIWLAAAVVGWLLLLGLRQQFSPLLWAGTDGRLVMWWLGLSGFVALCWLLQNRMRQPNWQCVAQRLENHFPSLQQRLLTAMQIGSSDKVSSDKVSPPGYLQRCVISEALRHDVRYRWQSLISGSGLALAWLANLPALLCLAFVAWQLWQATATLTPQSASTLTGSSTTATRPIIQPGDTELERGTSLIVTATFPQAIPDNVWLATEPISESFAASAVSGNRIQMRPSLNDPIYAAYLHDVQQPLSYRVETGGVVTDTYRVTVFDFPALVRADAELTYPEYTGLQPTTILDTRRITAAIGTRLTWRLQLNKAIELVELLPQSGEAITLSPTSPSADVFETTLELRASDEWKLRLVDSAGRTNPAEVVLRAKVLPNDPANIQLLTGGDVRVSPLEEFQIEASVQDDFAVSSAGIGYQLAGGEPIELPIPLETTTTRRAKLSKQIELESLRAEPDQLLCYYVWAEDRSEDGSTRRVVSDMFFAEVRPFDEIFRQGEQPAGGEPQQSQPPGDQQTEELLELQKQIVIAGWNVLRRATAENLDPASPADVRMLAESQQSAADLLQEKGAQSQVPGAQVIVARAAESMQAAIGGLDRTAQSLAKSDLTVVLSHQQAAYQELLRLQSKEHEVVRSQSSSSQSQSQRSQARQEQLDQLELSNQENRYENERLAQDAESEQQSELRQVISRLRELAARQEDFNEQLREVQAALQAAETEQQRQQLERQLQRLREQQQQMLADADELTQRMETQASDAMQQQSQQMQETRQTMQQASESLQQNNPSSALAAGTRAEQQLKQLQDDVRQQAASQFQQSVQEMQQQAAELEQRQAQLVDEMQPADTRSSSSPSAKSDTSDSKSLNLRSSIPENSDVGPKAGLRGGEAGEQRSELVRKQQEELQQLLEQMQHTVTQAEDAEPLLAQKLYDGFRKTQQERVLERLQVTEQLLERNLEVQARQLANESLQDLSELRQQIDQAAESVLGSELESLRRAASQLEELQQQLDTEIAEGQGQSEVQGQSTAAEADLAGEANSESEPSGTGESSAQGSVAQVDAANDDSAKNGQQAQANGEGQGRRESNPTLRGGGSEPTAGAARSDGAGPNLETPVRPLTGEGFKEWSDRLRDVEELVSDPQLRWQATEIRQAARELRADLKKHAAAPQWSEVEELVATPLRELTRQVMDEMVRKAADKTQIVPLDRDPVPDEFSGQVREYFENLGSGR